MRKKILLLIAIMAMVVGVGQAASTLKVAYVTNAATPPTTDEVFATLNRNFVATAINNANPDAPTVATWVSTYDVIVVSEYANSGNVQMKNLTKPVLMMKGHALTQDARWGWSAKNSGTDATGIEQNLLSQKSLKVASAEQGVGLYKGLAFVGDSVQLLSEIGMNAAQYKGFIAIGPRSGVAITNAGSVQPTPTSGCDKVVFWMPQGALADGANAMLSNYVYVGISSNSYTYLTANAKQLIVNAVKMLGGETPTGKEEMPKKVLYATMVTGNNSMPVAVDPLYNALVSAGYELKVQDITSSAATPDTAGQDMVVISELPGSGNLNNFKNLDKPVFVMKAHQLANTGRWNWSGVGATAGAVVQGPTQTHMYIPTAMKSDALFANLTIIGDSTQLLSQVGNSKGLMGVNKLRAGASATVYGKMLGTTSDTILFYYPAGTIADGTTALLSDYCYFGVTGFDSYKYMTKNAIQVALNAIAKLTGSAAKVAADAVFTLETATGGSVDGNKAAYYVGESYSMTATADVNYEFVKWEKKNGNSYDSIANTPAISGCMPASLTLRPVFVGTTPPAPSNKTKLNVAYVTKSTDKDSVSVVLDRNFENVTVVKFNNALTQANVDSLQKYDVVVLTSYFGGGDLYLGRNLTKPVVMLQGVVMPDDNNFYTTKTGMTRWSWVTSRYGHTESVVYEQNMVFQKAIEVATADQSNNLYKGLKYVGNTVCLLDTIARSSASYLGMITTAAPKTGTLKSKVSPEVVNGNSYAVYYQAKGNLADGTDALKSNYCYIGLNQQSHNLINANMKQLLVNAVKVVADSVPSGDEEIDGVAAPAITSVSLPSTLSVRVPAVATLVATVVATKLADNVIRWSSSDPTKVTVNQWGGVQAVSAGTATITAATADGSKTATCTVTAVGSAEVLLSEGFEDWERRTAKLVLPNTDSTPNFASGNNIINNVTIDRPLYGSAAGSNVEFTLKNVNVVPYAGAKFLNEDKGILNINGAGNNNLTAAVTTSPNPPTSEIQGETGTIVFNESALVIGQVNKEVKTIELVLSMYGDGRVAMVEKSYDGTTWLKIDADKESGSAGRTVGFVMPNQMANKFIVNLPRAEKNFYLRFLAGRSGMTALTAARTDKVNLHSVKYYGPNSTNVPVTSVGISVFEKPSSARVSNDTIYMTAPQSWCESAGIVKMTYACTPADASNTSVTWTSSNTAAVTVDATGNLVPQDNGTATLTAAAADGSGKTATMTVVVTKTSGSSVICPETVEIQQPWRPGKNYLQIRPDSLYQLESVVTPSNATHKTVTYATLSPDFASVSPDGIITGVNKGWATMVATVTTPNEMGYRVADTIDIQILAPIYIGGDPAPDSGAPKLPISINAREWTPTVKVDNKLDETWAKNKWFDFAKTGLRAEKNDDNAEFLNQTRIQGTYLNGIEENGTTADFANIGLKTTKLAGRQTRLIFAYDGELDSLKFGVVVTGSTYPSTVAVQQSNDAESWDDVHYIVNEMSATKENEVPAMCTQLTPNVYKYVSLKNFSKNSRFIRFYQTESGASSAVAHNIYFDGFWFYSGGGNTGVTRKNYTANYGINVYPNPTSGDIYLDGEKNITRVDIVNLGSGHIVKRLPMGGAQASTLSVADLASGTYLVVIFVEGSNLPQVMKVSKQ